MPAEPMNHFASGMLNYESRLATSGNPAERSWHRALKLALSFAAVVILDLLIYTFWAIDTFAGKAGNEPVPPAAFVVIGALILLSLVGLLCSVIPRVRSWVALGLSAGLLSISALELFLLFVG